MNIEFLHNAIYILPIFSTLINSYMFLCLLLSSHSYSLYIIQNITFLPTINSEYITQITPFYSEVTRIVDELPQTIFN